MERPKVEAQTVEREITGEIVYLDRMRRQNEAPTPFQELGDLAIQMYETEADLYADGQRPEIMDEYEKFDYKPSEVVASCSALANELLALKAPDSPVTFVDIVVEAEPEVVLKKLEGMSAGRILAGADEQLAIPSNGEYYPVLDLRKQNAKLAGVGLRAWGWDYEKYIFTNKKGEQYEYPKNALVYPSDEKSFSRQLEMTFSYSGENSERFTESVSLYIHADGSATISRNIWCTAYAETGYEGHNGTSLENITEDDIAAFGDLVAEIVGDEPESISMLINRRLQDLVESAATPNAQQAVKDLIEATWPAQASYFLKRDQEGTEKTIAQQICSEETAEAGVEAIRKVINEWTARMKG